jgi:hypothetical protein
MFYVLLFHFSVFLYLSANKPWKLIAFPFAPFISPETPQTALSAYFCMQTAFRDGGERCYAIKELGEERMNVEGGKSI